MTSLIHTCQKRALIPLKFEVIFNYDAFFKVAQSYPHVLKLAQLTVSTNYSLNNKSKKSDIFILHEWMNEWIDIWMDEWINNS